MRHRRFGISVARAALAAVTVGCAARARPSVMPAPLGPDSLSFAGANQPGVVGVTVQSGEHLSFDTLPRARMWHDTVFANVVGAAYVIPRAAIRQLWVARPGELPVSLGTSDVGAALARASAKPPLTPLRIGQRVRVTIPSATLYHEIAVLGAVSTDSLLVGRVSEHGDTIWLPVSLEAVQRIEVSAGSGSRRTWAGMGLGLLVGAGIGALIGELSKPKCGGFMSMCELAAPVGGVIGRIVGVVVGGIVGSQTHGERWVPVSVSELHRVRQVRP